MAKSKAQQKATSKYRRNNYDQLNILVKPKGKKEEIKKHAEKSGESLSEFVNRAIDETIKKDNSEQVN
jgi:predicted HicB family RNase H-like nuclease